MEEDTQVEGKKEQDREWLGDLVKLIVLIWSASLLTFSYVRLPNGQKILDFDPTFIASVFSGSLAAFGLAPSKNGGGSGGKLGPQKAPPIPDKGKTDPISGKKIDPQSGKLIL
tara:strand:- start:778 stop:1116 length:339 start_codon:yes stop_codon:yes gene_type:complete